MRSGGSGRWDARPGAGGRIVGVGRRRGADSTRQDILDAAIQVFAERGYEGASLRAITAKAGVDVSLVRYFFGGKEGLFDEAVVQQADLVAQLFGRSGERLVSPARTLADNYLSLWEEPATGPMFKAVFRSALESSRLRDKLESTMTENLGRFTASLPGAQNEAPEKDKVESLQLLAAHLLGIGLARYVLEFSPLADIPRERMLDDLARTIEQYIPASVRSDGDVAT